METLLRLENFGASFYEKTILQDVSLSLPPKGITTLLGPVASGKSTLLRCLCGVNNASPSLRTWGTAEYLDQPLGTSEWPQLVAQKAKLLIASVLENIVCELPERHQLTIASQRELAKRLLLNADMEELGDKLDDEVVSLPLKMQRMLAIIRVAATSPKMILLDEPTADIDDEYCDKIIRFLKQESEKRAILIVTHNQKHARQLGGHSALLAGGVIQEFADTDNFFNSPQSQPAKDLVATGSCAVAEKDPPQKDQAKVGIKSESPAKQIEEVECVSDAFGPRNFLWLKPGLLAGTPKPGLLYDLDYDLAALKRVGIKMLVTLTEKEFDSAALKEFGIKNIWFPIEDMNCPEIPEAINFCKEIEALLKNKIPTAFHCHAGLGRTGTMLASQLIWEGYTALEALEAVRKIEPRWVQSEIQTSFLTNFSLKIENMISS
ncbi:ATP-binding cassette domain-containing protein [Agarilytica rhodophyticola]|uniref:phosphatase domain-containing putative toxin n=1 Tax=Agarilytica rhodophyticola TaxID=1737490 RepID=UPI000B34A16B|nr:ATP-binding cassette domain-containing protein [Agarilytica rhodophyticola]